MESLHLTFNVDNKSFAEVDRFFIVSKEVLGNLKPMYEKMIPTVRSEVKKQFASEGVPKWKKLSKQYLASNKKMNSKFPLRILKLTRRLFWAATKKGAVGNIASVTNEGFKYGINLREVPYARIHNLGGKIKGLGKGYMLKREYLKLTKEGIRRMVQKAHRFIRSTMKTNSIKFTGGDGI